MKIRVTPTIQVSEVLLGQNVAYVAIRLDNACRDLMHADYGRLKELAVNHLIGPAQPGADLMAEAER
jgi:hypothetical protein